jgi:hypothetical protein
LAWSSIDPLNPSLPFEAMPPYGYCIFADFATTRFLRLELLGVTSVIAVKDAAFP